jgi:hypothetical protein
MPPQTIVISTPKTFKLNFWEEFAINTGIGALEVLVSSSSLSDQQKTDLQVALAAIQQVQADFAG